MSAPVRIRHEKQSDHDVLHYEGPLNEEAGIGLMRLYESVAKKCTFNFRRLTTINSRGISIWMNFIRDFRDEHDVVFEECPDYLVQQINMIPSLSLKVHIRSVMAEYVCEKCTKRTTRVINVESAGKDPDFVTTASRTSCDHCRGPATMEEDADNYFLFLER